MYLIVGIGIISLRKLINGVIKMNIEKIGSGKNAPEEINVIIGNNFAEFSC